MEICLDSINVLTLPPKQLTIYIYHKKMKYKFITFIVAIMLGGISHFCVASNYDINEGTRLGLTLNFRQCFDTTTPGIHNPKTPALIPRISQINHTLYFVAGCNNSNLFVLNENGIEVFSAHITNDSYINLPDNLEGTYEIHIKRMLFCFFAPIEL